MSSPNIEAALDSVLEDLEAMSDEEFQALHAKYKEGELAQALTETSKFLQEFAEEKEQKANELYPRND